MPLSASAAHLELGFAAAEIGSFDWDLVTRRLEWDDRLLEIFGYDRASWPGTIEAFAERLHPDDATRTLEALQHAIDTQGEYDAEFRVVLPSGEMRWVQGRKGTASSTVSTAAFAACWLRNGPSAPSRGVATTDSRGNASDVAVTHQTAFGLRDRRL